MKLAQFPGAGGVLAAGHCADHAAGGGGQPAVADGGALRVTARTCPVDHASYGTAVIRPIAVAMCRSTAGHSRHRVSLPLRSPERRDEGRARARPRRPDAVCLACENKTTQGLSDDSVRLDASDVEPKHSGKHADRDPGSDELNEAPPHAVPHPRRLEA